MKKIEMLSNDQFQERFSNRRAIKLIFKKAMKTLMPSIKREKFKSLKELKKI